MFPFQSSNKKTSLVTSSLLILCILHINNVYCKTDEPINKSMLGIKIMNEIFSPRSTELRENALKASNHEKPVEPRSERKSLIKSCEELYPNFNITDHELYEEHKEKYEECQEDDIMDSVRRNLWEKFGIWIVVGIIGFILVCFILGKLFPKQCDAIADCCGLAYCCC